MKLLFLTIFAVLILIPCFTMAALNLEQNYPSLPGGQTITMDSSLAEVILYVVGLAILVSGIIALISLIFGGIKYTSSAGRPEIMSDARNKINNSLLGILILVGSYLVLSYINPQLLVMRVEKAPINTGVILLTEQGKINLENGALIQNIIISGNARFLNYELKNLEEEFGELVAIFADEPPIIDNIDEANFKKFKPKYLGFFQGKGDDIKITPFSKADFKNSANSIAVNNLITSTGLDIDSFVYTYNGLIGYTEGADEGLVKTTVISSEIINGIWIVPLDFYEETISFVIKKDVVGNRNPIIREQNIPHPPLSFKIKSEGPGVYLYGINSENQVHLTSSINNLTSLKFNNKADTIIIKNKIIEQQETEHAYLAVLYEDSDFLGNFRIFFKQQIRNQEEVGNTLTTTAIKINNIDVYGEVDGVSSIQIFELTTPEESTCKEVRLCNKEEFGETGGRCISFLAPEARTPTEWYVVATSSLPIYIPTNIPQDLTDESLHKTISGQRIISPEKIKFADEIRSLHIEGKCLVVLFENPRTDEPAGNYWEDNTPGTHSEVFFPKETGRLTIFDLASAEQINKCSGAGGTAFWQSNPCASAIAIYPLK